MTIGNLTLRFRRSVTLLLAIAVLVLIKGGPFGAPVLEAQGPPDSVLERVRPIFELAGVVFTDADEVTGRVTIGVIDRDVEGLIRARLALLGMRSESVDVVETEPIMQVASLRDRVRPVVAGLQIRFSGYLCSLGFNARIADGRDGFVTASHCSTKQGSVDGTAYYQPLNQVPEEFIGTEVADPAYRRIPRCPRGRVCRYSDANFSEAATASDFALGYIAKTSGPNNGSLEIIGNFTITDKGTAALKETVSKVGRSTGWTQGTHTRTCVDTGVSGSNIVLLCQDFVENKNAQIVVGGDSGSPVFTGSSNVTLLGDLWGGNSSGTLFVYSPIANIEQELGALTVVR